MKWRAAAAAALVTAAVCFLIARGNSYQTFIIVTVGLTAIVGVGLNVLLGLSGQISLGHVASSPSAPTPSASDHRARLAVLAGACGGRARRRTGRRPAGDFSRFLAAGAPGSGISVRNLAVSFGGVHAVRDLSFDARAGAITSIIGPNGAGKTTALNAICGFYRPDAGTVKLGEQTVSELRAHQIPRAGIARTYQTSRLFESLSVIDNVLIALRRGKLGAASFFARAGSKRCPSALLRSRRAATSAPASFPAVSSRCSPSPAVLWLARKFSCSTSRRSAWRRNFWKSSMISWRSCAGRGRRSCSSTRWRRSRCRSPIGPMCCNPVRSSIRAARAKLPATRR